MWRYIYMFLLLIMSTLMTSCMSSSGGGSGTSGGTVTGGCDRSDFKWSGTFICNFGRGSYNTEGEITLPIGISVDQEGKVYVCSGGNNITKFDPSIQSTGDKKEDSKLRFITRWTVSCSGIEADESGNIYVATGYKNVRVYNSNGEERQDISPIRNPDSDNFQGSIYAQDVAVHDTLDVCNLCNNLNNYSCPQDYDCSTGGTGVVYVISSYFPEQGDNYAKVSVFDKNGNFLFDFKPEDTGRSPFKVTSHGPLGIAVDEVNDYIYVADTEAHKIYKFNIYGDYISELGGTASNQQGQLKFPRDVEVDSEGYLYEADTDAERIQVFDANGNFIMEFQGLHNPVDGPFHPRNVAIDHNNGYIYVTAAYANRIDKFRIFDDSNNRIITSQFTMIGCPDNCQPGNPANNGYGSENYIESWGWREKGNGVLASPQAIAIDVVDGYIYVADTYNTLIQKFDTSGNFITQWGYSGRVWTPYNGGNGYPCFDFPINIATDTDGNVYLLRIGSDYGKDPRIPRLQKYDSQGNFVGNWDYNPTNNNPYERPFIESMKGITYNPKNGFIYVSNTPNNVIQYFQIVSNDPDTGLELKGGFSFTAPGRIAADSDGNIYVVDYTNNLVKKLTYDGSEIWTIDGHEGGGFRFNENSGIFVDNYRGYIYIADSRNYQIQIYTFEGTFVKAWGNNGGERKFTWPLGVVVDRDGFVYVLDTGENTIKKFSPLF